MRIFGKNNFFEKISKKFKKRLAIWKHLCYNNIRRRVTRQTQNKIWELSRVANGDRL